MLAARVHLVVEGEVISEAKIRALWTEDEALSTRLNPEVVRSTGSAGYADAVQDGIAALRTGDEQTALIRLGEAVQIADVLGDQDKLNELSQVVDIVDAPTGKIRPKRHVDEIDVMDADIGSRKTVRARRRPDA